MPTYDYRCEKCGHQLEAFHKITQTPLTDCPKCNKPALKRGVGGQNVALRFKGSGFYITDYNQKSSSETKDQSSSDKR